MHFFYSRYSLQGLINFIIDRLEGEYRVKHFCSVDKIVITQMHFFIHLKKNRNNVKSQIECFK